MPSLTIAPPPYAVHPSSPPLLPHDAERSSFAANSTSSSSPPGSSSPVAPAYSPITPKVQPVFPATNVGPPAFVPPEDGEAFTFAMPDVTPTVTESEATAVSAGHGHDVIAAAATAVAATKQPAPTSAPVYIPQPPTLPFTGDDASDAIALRAAISTLQFQKQKAHDDLKALSRLKQLALDDPEQFRTQFVAGRLQQPKPRKWDLEALRNECDDDDSSDEDDKPADLDAPPADASLRTDSVCAVSQMSQDKMGVARRSPRDAIESQAGDQETKPSWPSIPESQNIARMPHINWDKYGIVGAPLDALHEQQRQWPGSTPYDNDKGRPFAVAAPYSPFYDVLENP